MVQLTHMSSHDPTRPTTLCQIETFLLRDVRDKINITSDTSHTRRWSERGVEPVRCIGDLAFFRNRPITMSRLRLWAHERTVGGLRNVEDLPCPEFADCRRHRRRSSFDRVRTNMLRRYREGPTGTARPRGDWRRLGKPRHGRSPVREHSSQRRSGASGTDTIWAEMITEVHGAVFFELI